MLSNYQEQNIASDGVTDLDLRLEMIIFESILTTFEASTIFWGSWGSSENQLEPTNSDF